MQHVARLVLFAFCIQFLAACADDGTIRKRDVGMVVGGAGGAVAGQAIGGSDPTALVLGTLLGDWAHHHIKDTIFTKLTYAILLLSAVFMAENLLL